MSDQTSSHARLKHYSVWDLPTRLFHWINVLCVVTLIAIGTFILNAKVFGVSGDGKILLKTIHVYVGYVFAVNLLWRLVWGFIGNYYSRWKTILPFGKQYRLSLDSYVGGLKRGKTPTYLGHNPLAKLMVTFLFLLLITQASTGLILAGTDLYFPPFGHEIAEWVSGSDEEHKNLTEIKPGSDVGVDPVLYAEMRSYRKPVVTTHVYVFYLLLISIVVHIAAVIFVEFREKNALISAMFTGKKILSEKPLDTE